ncbi:MAG TPA: glycosyltransferase [Candidatus Sumerlaeota bacterium]|nr:glycosyltransferase [Candidatus Sumerlaeota bacterium]
MTAEPKQSPLLSILMPVYNERAYLERCVERVVAAPLPDGMRREIVMVDDCSTDGTPDLIRHIARRFAPLVRPFFQEPNQGKGATVRRAIQEMQGDYAIIQDADLEYDPNEYERVLMPLLENGADVVYGSRFAAGPRRKILNYHHALGNLFLTHLSNFFTGLNLTDMETCYKAFRADILKTIPLRSNRFGIEPEITAKIAKRGCCVYEVPISYHGRSYAEGKKIGWKDGVSALRVILKYWLLDDCYEERYGHQILADLSQARRFNQWMAECIHPWLGQTILEVGSGIGSISRQLPHRRHLIVSDMDPVYLELLKNAYQGNALVDVEFLDLTRDENVEHLRDQEVDTIVCLNVLEHIENDADALKRMHSILAPGGRLVLLVPQYAALYGSYDRQLGHHRRYTRQMLRELFPKCGYRLAHMQSYNFLAIPGWWVNSCLLKRDTMGKSQIKLFDLLVPIMRLIEKILPLPGLSLIAVGEKGHQPNIHPRTR